MATMLEVELEFSTKVFVNARNSRNVSILQLQRVLNKAAPVLGHFTKYENITPTFMVLQRFPESELILRSRLKYINCAMTMMT